MAQISWRRSNQFRHFVLHLKLTAIYPQQVLFASVQYVRQHLNGARLACARGAQQKKNAGG